MILCSSHFSAVLARLALRRPRLWPIKGIPSEPGGNLFDDLLPFVRRKKMGMRNREMGQENIHDLCVAFGFLKWWGKMRKQDWFLREKERDSMIYIFPFVFCLQAF